MKNSICLRRALVCIPALLLSAGCAMLGVRQADLDAWVGQPIIALETHPMFLTIPVVKTVASDGTQIWNYVNGKEFGQCSTSGSGLLSTSAYSQVTTCMQNKMACNNIFFINDGKVLRYTPVGSGGARCITNDSTRPQRSAG